MDGAIHPFLHTPLGRGQELSTSGRACLITSGSNATSRFGCIMCVLCLYAGFV